MPLPYECPVGTRDTAGPLPYSPESTRKMWIGTSGPTSRLAAPSSPTLLGPRRRPAGKPQVPTASHEMGVINSLAKLRIRPDASTINV